jgi:tRNA-specific 2-thiouridylase
MKTWGFDDFPEKDSGCCSLETIYNARNVANTLGIDHYTVDFTELFNEKVITNFIDEYSKGRTPNPCVLCNKVIKWGALLKKAEELNAEFLATGHYAKIESSNNKFYISKSIDLAKDQSYALWQLSQYALSKTLLPLGNYNKTEIRKIASELGLKTADTPDSQEICFVPDNDYKSLLEIRIPDYKIKYSQGDIIYKGSVIGKHSGFPNYTIGQRRGLGLSLGKPVYVSKIDPDNNFIYVDDEENLYNDEFIIKDLNFMKFDDLYDGKTFTIKIRYKDNGSSGYAKQISENAIKLKFDEPKKAITPGQSCVIYDKNDIAAGGIIDKIIQ